MQEKSPCCRTKTWRINNKRRQCSSCKKTWTAWKKKRGRKKERKTFEKLFQYLSHFDGTTRQKALQANKIIRTEQKRMQRLLNHYCEVTNWPDSPQGALLIIPDALIINFDGKPWTLYCFLIRSIKDNVAVIAKPVLLLGREGQSGGWCFALDSLPSEVTNRIVAISCDGAMALIGMARRKGWILQRCYFHLKARFRHNVSTGPMGWRTEEGRRIQRLVDCVVTSRREDEIQMALNDLSSMIDHDMSKSLRRVTTGFLKNYEDYRSYLNYPELNLPRTSNSAESLMKMIRRLQYKAHGFSTPESFYKWVEALFKYRKTINCNPANHLQN